MYLEKGSPFRWMCLCCSFVKKFKLVFFFLFASCNLDSMKKSVFVVQQNDDDEDDEHDERNTKPRIKMLMGMNKKHFYFTFRHFAANETWSGQF